MKRIIFAVVISIFFVSQAQAAYVGNVKVREISTFVDGFAILSIDSSVAGGVCDYWSYEFKLDVSTSEGEIMHKSLAAAAAMGRSVDLWYKNSSVPGTNQSNGCTQETMAEVWGVGLHGN